MVNLIKAKCNRIGCEKLARFVTVSRSGYMTDAACSQSYDEMAYFSMGQDIVPISQAYSWDVEKYNEELKEMN